MKSMADSPIRVLCINGESDPAETGSFIEMHRMGIDITVITWPGTPNYKALVAAGVETTGRFGRRRLSLWASDDQLRLYRLCVSRFGGRLFGHAIGQERTHRGRELPQKLC